MKLQQKDLVMIGAFVAVALIIYVFFFTSLGFGGGASSEEASTKAKGFGNFNTTVEKKPVEEFETKSEAYQAEMQEEADREKQAQQLQETKQYAQETYKEGSGVNDLSALLKKDGKTSTPVKEEKTEAAPVVQENKQVRTTTTATVKKKSVTTTTIVKEPEKTLTTKKKRKSDPVFGEVSDVSSTTSTKTEGGSSQGLGVVHQQTTAKQNSAIQIRVTEAFSIRQCEIKSNSFLTGYCSYSSYGRMLITVKTLNCNGKIVDVNLQIYDGYDGLEGIAIKEASDEQEVGKEVVGGVVGDAARKFGIRSVDRAVSSESNRKLADPSVVINSGHKLILKEVIQ